MSEKLFQHTQAVKSLLEQRTAFVCITLLDIRGSAPQIAGAKALVTSSGLTSGTVGGGKIEAAAITYAQELLNSGNRLDKCELKTWNLQTDIGMTCGGEVKLFFEIHDQSAWPIAVFGAGHVAQALVPLLLQLECQVTCIDPRPEWLARLPDHPGLQKRCMESPKDAVLDFPGETYFVLISKGHSTDLPVLHKILVTRNAPYIGVIGSKQKASVLRRELTAREVQQDKIETYHCPIGLSIGNNTPIEIAISIAGQLLQVRGKQ